MATIDKDKSPWLDASGVEPIAIIGSACRFSGIASNQDALWQLLSKGMTSWASNARSRFNLESFWHPHAHLSGSTNARGLHLLNEDPAYFDNDFFGISGVEAKAIDPQQRLMLEIAYETFENAGIPLEKLEGSNTGVYCAVAYTDYDLIQNRDQEVSPMYRFTGTGPSLLSNRVSYVFDLHGPSKSVDTACSSTLVALHDACQALRAGDADQMLVGGSNLILDPDKLTVISSMQFLSPHGRCYSFDSRASGYARGEGIAAILLKPLSAALRDGDHIRSVIRGSSIVSDGKTPGITMPSPVGQFNGIRRAYESAGLDPRETVYVEAHGTGTNAGDDCEATAFSKAFCNDRADKLLVGSIKSNLGHTECVSGLAGLIKVLLMLEKGAIVPNPTFSMANPKLELDKRGIKVPTKLLAWPEGTVRRASINGSGYGGTNTHVILEAWTGTQSLNPINGAVSSFVEDSAPKPNVYVWSHQREGGFSSLASSWRKFLLTARDNHESISLADIAFTLFSRRSRFPHRVAVVASDLEELLEGIKSIQLGSNRPVKALLNAKTVYIFTGQGAQWAHMGLELLSHSVFAQSLQAAERDLIRFGATWRLIDELKKDHKNSRINDAELAQPSTTAIQIALVDLLASWNVHPDLVCGHSSGEIAAAYAAGGLTFTDALKVAFFRGKAVFFASKMKPERKGGMLAVGLSETEAQKYLSNYDKESINVACINSPSSVTISGDIGIIKELSSTFETEGIFNRQLAVEVAYHSSHMVPIEEYYLSAIESIQPRALKSNVRMVSSVTGEDIQGDELTRKYWARNLLHPVRFSDALSKILRKGAESGGTVQPAVIVEVGPHSALRGPVLQTVKSIGSQSTVKYVSCLQRKQDALTSAMVFSGEVFTYGLPIDLDRVNNLSNTLRKVLTTLPAYNWHHKKAHWIESRRSEVYRKRKFPRHDLLGSATADSISAEPSWRMYIRQSEMPWIKGHCVDGQVVFSAAGFITMVVEALKRQFVTSKRPWKGAIHFKRVILDRALLIQDDAMGAEVFTLLRPYAVSSREMSSKWQEFRIYSVSQNNESMEHCRGLVGITENVEKLTRPLEANGIVNGDHDPLNWTQMEPEVLYKQLRGFGNDYSGCFANLDQITARPWKSHCTMTIPDVKSTMPSGHQQPHHLHPTTLEGCFQACLPGVKLANHLDGPQVVTTIDDLFISTGLDLRPGNSLSIAAYTAPHGLRQHSSDIDVRGVADISLIIRVKGIKFSSLENYQQVSGSQIVDDAALCHRVAWRPDPFSCPKQSLQEYCQRGLIYRNQQLRKVCDPFCLSLVRDGLAQLKEEDMSSITGHVQWFLKWMLDQDISAAEPVSAEGQERTNAVGAPGEMLVRLGAHTLDILRGSSDTVSLLLENDLLYRLYFEDDCLNRCHAQLAQYLKLVQFKIPGLRILEIGGGTGSLTFSLLEALYDNDESGHPANRGTYVFTDVSTSFTTKIQRKVKKYESYMEFKRLDIEQPAEPQGFELGSFDVIVASNVVHATHSIGKTLNNLKALLKPGGQIAMTELTAPSLRWGILGGGITGWWLGAEEGRTSSPLLSTQQWDEVLIQNGFAGVSLEMKDYESAEEHEASLLIAHASNTELKTSVGSISIVTRNSRNAVAGGLGSSFVDRYPGTEVSVVSLSKAEANPGTYVILPGADEDALFPTSENEWVKIQALLSEAKSVLWVTKRSSTSKPSRVALIRGLGRNLRSANKDLEFFSLDLDLNIAALSEAIPSILEVYEKYIGPSASPYSAAEWEIAVQDGAAIVIPRLIEDDIVKNWVEDSVSKFHPREESQIDASRSLALRINTVGRLESLYWADSEVHGKDPQPSQIRVQLENFALNFKDMLTLTGQLEGHSALLVEGSGTVVEVGDASQSKFSIGDRVCFFGPDGLATVSNVDMNHAVLIPGDIPMNVAAAIPVAYSAALFALRDVARLRQEDSVLIHSGAGAVGQAAIAIAKYLGVKNIFVTAGSDERRAHVRRKFGIPAERILSHQDSNFGDQILQLTNGRGVDVILNSLSGEAVTESCSAIAYFGRIIHLGKKDMANDGRLEMKHLEKNVSFSVVDIALLAKERPMQFKELLQTSLNMIQSRGLSLIGPIGNYHALRLEEQLRKMQAGEHTGKMVFRLDSSLPLKVQPQKPQLASLRPDSSYLVAGSARHIDKAIVKLLAKLGARHIVMLLNDDNETSVLETFVAEIKQLGAELLIMQGSISKAASLTALKDINRRAAISGIILGDAAVKGTSTQFKYLQEAASSNNGIANLQNEFSSSLDFFISLGRTSSLVGVSDKDGASAEQSFRDAFAEYEISARYPVTSIYVGMVHDEETITYRENLPPPNYTPQTLDEVLAVVNYAIQRPATENSPQGQIVCGAKQFNPDLNTIGSSTQRPDARFSHVWSRTARQVAKKGDDDVFDAQTALRVAPTAVAATEASYTGLKQKLASLLAIPVKEIQPDRSVASYGVDSLISVELRNWIAGQLGSHVQMLELMSSLTMVQLAEVVAKRSRFVTQGVFGNAEES